MVSEHHAVGRPALPVRQGHGHGHGLQVPLSPLAPLPVLIEPSAVVKLTRGHSCVLCQQRKVRCDKQKPCANCLKAGVECRVVPPQPPRRRKKRPHERDLLDRLRRYEALLAQHGIRVDPVAEKLKMGNHGDDVTDLEHDLSGRKTSPSSSNDHASPEEDGASFHHYTEYRGHGGHFQECSGEEYEGLSLHQSFDTMFDSKDGGFPFIIGVSMASITAFHPSSFQISQLWHFYVKNVNPLLKTSHVPTLQEQIVSAGANTTKLPKPLEALMFAIYLITVNSLTPAEVQATFGEDRTVLLAKYQTAAQQALINASFMKANEVIVLEAYFLYLTAVREYTDPRTLFCLIGIAVRIANRLGLHRDGSHFSLSPFETEQRRRLWWQIAVLDKRIAEITGSSTAALSDSPSACDVRLPLNINDMDLNIHAKAPPTESQGPTEMLFPLTRIALTQAAAGGSMAKPPGGSPLSAAGGSNVHRVQFSPSPASPDMMTHVGEHNLPGDLGGYCSHIEQTYLGHINHEVPQHRFAFLMTRQALCKLRVIEFMCRGISSDTLEEGNRQFLAQQALDVIEYDNMIHREDIIKGYVWYMKLQVPFPAYIFLVSELRKRPSGKFCEKSWAAIFENHNLRDMMRGKRSPMHVTFGHFIVKAWEAHEAAEMQLGRSIDTPRLISILREQAPSRLVRRPMSIAQASGCGQNPVARTPASVSSASPVGSEASARRMPVESPSVDLPGRSGMVLIKPQPPQQPQPPSHLSSMGGGDIMVMDDAIMYGGFDSVNLYGGQMQDVGYSGMDWNYLMYHGGFGLPLYEPHGQGSGR